MPLSDEEKRILAEIEERFYADDPAFAREVSTTTLYSVAFRNLKWSTFGFLVGVVVLVATLSTSVFLAFGGFLIMLGSAFLFERNARKLGKAGWDHVSKSMRAAGLRDAMGGAGKKMRDRFKREGE